MIAMVRHSNRLSIPLSLIVHPARPDRVHIAPVGFWLLVHKRVAVGLGCGRQQEARALLLGNTGHVVGAKCSDFERMDGQVKVIDGGCRGCVVEYVVYFITN